MYLVLQCFFQVKIEDLSLENIWVNKLDSDCYV